MTNQVLIFAENQSQIPQLVDFSISTGAKSVDYAVVEKSHSHLPEQLGEELSIISKDRNYKIIALPATKLGREIAPRLAVRLHSGYVDSVTRIERVDGDLLFQRLTLGGTCLESIKVKTKTTIVTLQLGGDLISHPIQIDQTEVSLPSENSEFKKELLEERILQSPESIQNADRIVAIGRGIRKREDVTVIEEFAHALKATIGVTRPLVEDLKWYPKERQIGLSGNTIKPQLYVGLGISGQVQHIVGMRNSKVVVAVNKDRTAPIHAFADYSLIGDLYTIVPEMTRQLKEKSAFR